MSVHDFCSELISNNTFSAAIVEARGYNQWIINFYKDYIRGDVLEIGVGHGSFVRYMPSTITSYTGFDIDPDLIKHAKKFNPGIAYICGDLSDSSFEKRIENRKFDTILCINVLEHIPNHGQALKNMLSALKTDGAILLFVPAFMELYQDMDKLAGHERRYVVNDLKKLCEENSCILKKWSYFNSIGGFGWWLNKFRKHANLNSHSINSQIKFFEKYVLPFSKLLQKCTAKFFGQSLYAVIKKGSL